MRAPAAFPVPALALLLAFAFASATAACDRAPAPGGMREWTPQDHDGEQRGAGAKQGARGSADAGGPDLLVEMTWQKQCASCHGPGGRGDGPQGPMVKARDLSTADWQGKIDDAQIAATIRNGKGSMPKFDKLPDEVVAGLVRRIRSFRSR